MSIIFSRENYFQGAGWKYSDLQAGAVTVKNRNKPVTVELIPLEANDRQHWQSSMFEDRTCDCAIYEVTLKEEDVESHIENLIYFFICADRVNSGDGEGKSQLGLLVHVSGRDRFRLRSWLSMMAWENPRYNLLYTVDDPSVQIENKMCYPIEIPESESGERRSSTGRIMPLLRVVKPKAALSAGDVALSSLSCADDITGDIKLSDDDIREYMLNKHSTRDVHWWESLQDLCKVYLIHISQSIRGTTENNISEEDKKRIREKLSEFIISMCRNMSFFSELCWLYNLQYLMEKKDLLIPKEKDLNMVVLQQSYLDAITYADGILQVLENSCQHSQQHSAYLSMRIHNVSREGTDLQLFESIPNREKLANRYEQFFGERWDLEKNARYYMEISVTDDAFSGKDERKGILTVYRKNAQERYKTADKDLPKSLSEVFSDAPMAMTKSNEGVVHHYGIPALKQIVVENGGVFLVSSPHGKDTEILKITKKEVEQTTRSELNAKLNMGAASSMDETSEYHILFPLGLNEYKSGASQNQDDWTAFFEDDRLKDAQKSNVATAHFDVRSYFEDVDQSTLYLEQENKIAYVQKAVKAHEKKLEDVKDPENCIQFFDLRGVNGLQLELFAKFLFYTILEANGEKRLYAVYFDDDLKEQELIRLFAIFYYRAKPVEGGESRLRGAQIALCSTNPAFNIPEVNLILNITDWHSLLESARRYAYCNLESAQKIYSQIKYLDRNSMNHSTGLPVFPFDLYLTEEMVKSDGEDSESADDVSKKCWFIRRIYKVMEQDLQRKPMGIKVSDIHAYLPSNIQIESFYEAEQLFHNIAYVYRFAYLMALRLLRNGYSGKKHMIVCYEAYSALVGQCLADILGKALGEDSRVVLAIMYQEKKGHSRLIVTPSFSDVSDRKKFYEECSFITLCPIGSTMSTIHIMHDCIAEETGRTLRADNMRDIVIILVAEEEPAEIQNRYWRFQNDEKGAFEPFSRSNERVKLHGRYSESEWNVEYFLTVKAKWHDSEEYADNLNERALVHADSTSTELNMVFPLKEDADDSGAEPKASGASADMKKQEWETMHTHDVCSLIGFNKKEINNKRVKLLDDCVYYGHIVKESNHYGFYLDLPRYFNKIKNKELSGDCSYAEWLKELRRSSVDKDAFNIIVTPLRNESSPLLKDLLDSVFEHSIHILQLDFHHSRRTDVRTKYSYITRECNEAVGNNQNTEIHVYYIDDSIVTAETLNRGYSLVKMLLKDIPSPNKEIFKGVFVLVNRSSMDTVQTFVEEPKKDFHAFVHLAVPHYNTRKNRCPACEQVDKYNLLVKRSTTNRFAEEYQRLSEKHKLRTVDEYEQWQKEQLMSSPGAFLRLRQWMFYQDEIDEQVKKVRDSLYEFEKRFCIQFCRTHGIIDNSQEPYADKLVKKLREGKELQQEFLKSLEQEYLEKLLPVVKMGGEDTLRSDLNDIWLECVLREKAGRRLMAAHRAYNMLPLEIELNSELPGRYSKMRAQMLEYLTPDSECKSAIERWEYILSGLKVVSRDYLARHHQVRETAFYILRCVADIMQGRVLNDEDIHRLFRDEVGVGCVPALEASADCAIDPLLRYQMFQSVLHRLSDMESNYSILALSEGTILQKLSKLTETFFSIAGEPEEVLHRWYFCTIPSYEKMIFEYENCVKLATMSEDEENKSMLILSEHKHMSGI